MTNRNRLTVLCLFLLLAGNSAKAGPGDFIPFLSARPYWYNPGALCFDTSSAVNAYGNYIPAKGYNMFFGIQYRFIEDWLSGEILLPGKAGALGMQVGFTENIGWTWDTRTAAVTYANGIPIGSGRLGLGIQAELKQLFYVDPWSFWDPRFSIRRDDDIKPELAAGVLYQSKGITAGISGGNLSGSIFRLNILRDSLDASQSREVPLYRELTFTFSYRLKLMKDWELHPATKIFFVLDPDAIPGEVTAYQISATVSYQNQLHLGASFVSSQESKISVNAGIKIGRADIFAILPLRENYRTPQEYRVGISYRFGSKTSAIKT